VSTALHVEAEILELTTRHPFLIARGGQAVHNTVWVRVRDRDGRVGWGEAAPTSYYGETPETVLAALNVYAAQLPADPFDLEAAERALEHALGENPAARAGLSTALHDLVGKRLGVPLHRLWGLDPAQTPISTFTIGLDTPDKMHAKVIEAEPYPVLKVKLGTNRDQEILRTIRSATDKELRVDANCGWTRKQAIHMLPVLEEFGVTVLEQPLPAHDRDESCLVATDIPPLVGAVDGINIKLAKCGSLREALRMIAVARAHGLMVMVGCMIESSIAITAAAHFTPLVDLVDLDGAALLAADPFAGATIERGRIVLPSGPGLGVRAR
jgi:L-Ala-D/L-Glu epimerase